MPQATDKQKAILDAINYYRVFALEAVECEFGDLPGWPLVRKRLFWAFGDRGLPAKILEILNRT